MKNDLDAVDSTGKEVRSYYLLAGWLVLNLFSAVFTELSYDEAYYWMYSRFPAWGYFDHPPMIAWLVKAGTVLLSGEVGVRLLLLLCSGVTIWLLYRMMDRSAILPLTLILCAVFPFHMFGFMSVPDGPLLLFGCLFFYSYKLFLRESSFRISLLLAVSMAGLLYSKYHGILFIGATLVSNPALVKNRKALLAGLLAGLLYVPHVWWQHQHDYITLWFQLVGRSSGAYHYTFTVEYLLTQPLFYGPFAGILLFYCSWKYKTVDLFEKALRFTFIGTFVFFLLSTFKGRVEANWTLPALIPMAYLTVRYLSVQPSLLKWLRIAAVISLPLFVAARVLLAFPGSEVYFHRMGEIAGGEKYAHELMEKAGDLPLIANSYQEASKISFYSGKLVPSLNLNGRHNQYDLWNLARVYEGKPVVFLNNFHKQDAPHLNPKKDTCYLTTVQSLPVYQGLMIASEDRSAAKNSKVKTPLYFKSLSGYFPVSMVSPVVVHYFFRDKKTNEVVKQGEQTILPAKAAGGRWEAAILVDIPEKTGVYKLSFAFDSKGIGEWGTWKANTVEVK